SDLLHKKPSLFVQCLLQRGLQDSVRKAASRWMIPTPQRGRASDGFTSALTLFFFFFKPFGPKIFTFFLM
ncbi:MAG: hypothetical protein IJA79_01380, partial [Desulfovibrio sp.]|nr:hypothetical protein [Desulfovibrio sp.]